MSTRSTVRWWIGGYLLVLLGAALLSWSRPARSPHPGQVRPPLAASAAADFAAIAAQSRSSPKPAAMRDAVTYAATRLEQIKADPAAWTDVWTWKREYDAADSAALQGEVLGLAKQLGAESYLAVLEQALASEDFLVRLDAARSLALLPENRLLHGVAIAMRAADPEIRREVMEVVAQAQPKLRVDLLRETLTSGPADVQQRSVELLTDQPAPAYFAVLLEGLQSQNAEVRAQVATAIEAMVEQRFATYEAATQWWAANRESYDGMLLRER